MRMFVKPLVLLGLAGLAVACAPAQPPIGQPAPKVAPSDVDRISYSLGPCRGFCPAFTFDIAGDGISFFDGHRHTATTGRVSVNGDPMLFKRIKDELAPIRPDTARASYSHENCELYATDQQEVTVTWFARGQASRTLTFDLGCRDEKLASLRSALAATRRLLPINQLVGRATEF